jgi:hypothetical protein
MTLKPGDQVQRRELHDHLGGQTQSGISPSSRFPVILLFSNPSGEDHGYYDGWHDDGFFHYSGEGQRGDQEMRRGNKAIRDHVQDDRQLHLFLGQGKGRPVTYMGRFELEDYYTDDVPETGGGPLRKVIMFRLHPIGDDDGSQPRLDLGPKVTVVEPAEGPTVEDVPPEEHQTERYFFDRSREPTEAERREARLLQDYIQGRRASGHQLVRQRITIPGEAKPLFTDLYDATDRLLIEAKGTVTREAIRMAIGQLLDYQRWVTPRPKLAVLLPERPRDDLVRLMASCNVALIYRDETEFRSE